MTNDLLFSNFHQLRPSVEPLPVAREAGDDMKMEVEEVLITRRSVVLSQRHAIRREHAPSRRCDSGSHRQDRARQSVREFVDVLDVLPWDKE